jgi:hypothetical protein
MDARGQIAQRAVSSTLVEPIDLLQVGGEEFVLTQHHQGAEHGAGGDGIHTDILRLRATGETQLFAAIAGLCYRLAASSQRIACAVSPAMRSDQTNDALVAYSATGQEPWPHALERRDIVDRIRLLASGDLIYSIRQPGGATVTRLAASGASLWSETLRSSGEYTFLTGIEPLMLLVTDALGAGLGAPNIVSTIVNRTPAQ